MPTPLAIRIGIWVWLIAALVAARLDLLRALPGPALPLLPLLLTAALLALHFKTRTLRAWVDGLELRALVLLHVTRFTGFFFLLLHGRGELPSVFALPAGWGECTVAFLALPAALAPMGDELRRRVLTVWNVVGLAGISLMLLGALRLGFAGPGELRALGRLPLSLLPTFLTPVMLFTHVILFLRLNREAAPAA